MPIMYEPEVARSQGHSCKPPSGHYNQYEKAWESRRVPGTLWKCRKCGTYYETRNPRIIGKHWYKVNQGTTTYDKVLEIEAALELEKAQRKNVSLDKFFRDIWNALAVWKG